MDLAGLTLKSSAELWMQAARQPLMSLNTARGLKIPSLISYCILSYLYMLYLWCCSTRSYRVNLQYQNAIVPCFPASIFLPTPEEETWDLVDFQPPELHLAPQQRPWKVIGNSLSKSHPVSFLSQALVPNPPRICHRSAYPPGQKNRLLWICMENIGK